MFNSKERFFLVGQVLGNREFKPSSQFLKKLSQVIGISIPKNVFSAMDYHLDWLYASLVINEEGQQKKYSNEKRIIRAQQEDVDYILAFEVNGMCNIILIEAKGVTAWSNKQLTSKAKRLKKIFGAKGNKWSNIKPYFVLMSPRKPENLEYSGWPDWMCPDNIKYIPIEINKDKLRKVTRCAKDGTPCKDGNYWKIAKR
jgi:hypothetical protein